MYVTNMVLGGTWCLYLFGFHITLGKISVLDCIFTYNVHTFKHMVTLHNFMVRPFVLCAVLNEGKTEDHEC